MTERYSQTHNPKMGTRHVTKNLAEVPFPLDSVKEFRRSATEWLAKNSKLKAETVENADWEYIVDKLRADADMPPVGEDLPLGVEPDWKPVYLVDPDTAFTDHEENTDEIVGYMTPANVFVDVDTLATSA